MKTEALKILRHKLSNKEEVFGLWVTMESASITEMAVALGMDWVIVDAEHGHLDLADILEHIRATVRSNTVVLVRIAQLEEGLIKRLLDIGADGIVIPRIQTSEELQRAVSYSKYPPEGTRGIGAERATGWGDCLVQHLQEANENVLIVPIIESMYGGDNIGAMLDIHGTEIFFFGPADYSASAGHAGEWDNPIVNDHINHVKELVIRSGKYCGILTKGGADLERRKKEGYQMLALGFDTGLLLKSLKHALAETGRHRTINTSLSPLFHTDIDVLPGPPPLNIQPDRYEKIVKTGEGDLLELAPGIICEVQVGKHTESVNLFTALVTFEPGAIVLPAHSHPHSESITLLSGYARVQVYDRSYTLQPLDNITIPRDCVHSVQNLSNDAPAVFHIAMPTTTPQRDVAENFIEASEYVPNDFSGHKGPERITRHSTAWYYPGGANAEFTDFFNDILMPGIGMSGGYGLFHPGGRLPAHLHDFDESICIIKGEATCFVEGRQYLLSDYSTAIQPRGRIHYFINNSPEKMAMIWVYAGPRPERIEVEDKYATSGLVSKQ